MLALDPNQTCEVKLALDKERSFTVRYLTCRQTIAYAEALKAAVAETDDAKAYALLIDALRPILTGWRGFDKPFALEALQDVLTPGEAWELAHEIPAAVRLSEMDKKKSYWQSQSVGAKAVITTAPESASTHPAAQAL
jgi:hypothetical protein